MPIGVVPPDPGLELALKLPDLPDGVVFDFGFGIGQHLWPLAEALPGKVTGYDTHPRWHDEAEAVIAQHNVKVVVRQADALLCDIPQGACSIIVIGMTVYLTKVRVREFLQRAWAGLMVGGVLMVSFATPEDAVMDIVGPWDMPLEVGSYQTNCPCGFCGNYGMSVWTPEEADQFVLGLGPNRLIYRHLQELEQELEYATLHRSFYYLTVQKVG